MLRELGFAVREEPFAYSAFPGRYATPIAGAVLAACIVASNVCALAGAPAAASAFLVGGTLGTGLFAEWLLRSGVLSAPWMRAESQNLVCTRGPAEPRVWLIAHLDSKSQPVPSAVRVAGVLMLVFAILLTLVGFSVTQAGVSSRLTTWVAIVVAVIGALPVMTSVVGTRSDGAVDNASGVAAVLAAAARISPMVSVGVLLPSAEELGLAGARAWVRTHASGIALNCDGVDDGGTLVAMYNRQAPARVITAIQNVAHAAGIDVVRPRRMPLGLLTDSSAFASAGWEAVTLSHGSLATLGRVHTARDSLANLRGSSIDKVAEVLAGATEALATSTAD